MRYIVYDKKYNFKFAFDTETGAYVRTGILDENGRDTGVDCERNWGNCFEPWMREDDSHVIEDDWADKETEYNYVFDKEN